MLPARAMVTRPGGDEALDARANFALEEALFLKNRGLLLRVWENQESVIIGRAQLAQFETDLPYCEAEGIPVVRRFTAGGAVYNGPGNLNWSVFVAKGVEEGKVRYLRGPMEIFRTASVPVVSALAAMGVKARLEPPNSIVNDRGKISGMAAYVSKDGFLCHGTLLVDADLDRVKRLTTPSPQPLERRYTRSRDVRTANTKVGADSFIRTFVSKLGDVAGMHLDDSGPDDEETALAEELLASKYSKDSWNLGDPFAARGQARAG